MRLKSCAFTWTKFEPITQSAVNTRRLLSGGGNWKSVGEVVDIMRRRTLTVVLWCAHTNRSTSFRRTTQMPTDICMIQPKDWATHSGCQLEMIQYGNRQFTTRARTAMNWLKKSMNTMVVASPIISTASSTASTAKFSTNVAVGILTNSFSASLRRFTLTCAFEWKRVSKEWQ